MLLRNGTQNTRESILQWVEDATSSSCVQLLASTLYRQYHQIYNLVGEKDSLILSWYISRNALFYDTYSLDLFIHTLYIYISTRNIYFIPEDAVDWRKLGFFSTFNF